MIGLRSQSRRPAAPVSETGDPPKLAASTQGDLLRLSASGRWELQAADAMRDNVAALTVPSQVRRAEIDLRHVAFLDTAGAFAVRFILSRLEEKGLTAKTSCASEAATTLLGVGISGRDESLDSVTHAAMTSVARLLLNLDEAIHKN